MVFKTFTNIIISPMSNYIDKIALINAKPKVHFFGRDFSSSKIPNMRSLYHQD